MANAHIGFLYNAASSLLQTERNRTQFILRSHYLMRCMQLTKGYGLPDKHFSVKTRCPHCCTEWQKDMLTKIKSIKLSKKQKKRLKSKKPTKRTPDPKSLLHSNELEKICSFCKRSTVTPVLKQTKKVLPNKRNEKPAAVAVTPNNTPKQNKTKIKEPFEKKPEASIYYNAKEIFSLKNKNNTLASNKPNIAIKNNKRKKDKFAGLCKQAVLTSAKLKEAKDKNSLLSKFLKTST